MKTFGGIRPDAQREPFTLNYYDVDEEPQAATFQAVSRVSGADIAGIMLAMDEGADSKGVTRLMKLLTKVMDNRDGEVKHGWAPDILEEPAKAVKAIRADRPYDSDAGPDAQGAWPEEPVEPKLEPSYRGPNGHIYRFSDKEALAAWMDQSRWTSRRRWAYLMEEDDSAVVDMQDLMKIAEWVIALSSDRPTPARA